MSETFDLSGTPACEDCSQIGQDPRASERSRHEALAYRAALIATIGPPPTGYELRVRSNQHDFGTYYSVELRYPSDDALSNAEYEDLADQGLSHWHQAVMPAPYEYRPSSIHAIAATSPSDEAIRRAIIASRPNPDGTFPIENFKLVHERLSAAYPHIATAAAPTIALIHAQDQGILH